MWDGDEAVRVLDCISYGLQDVPASVPYVGLRPLFFRVPGFAVFPAGFFEEPLARAAAFGARVFVAADFFGGAFAFLFAEAPPLGVWPLGSFFALKSAICFLRLPSSELSFFVFAATSLRMTESRSSLSRLSSTSRRSLVAFVASSRVLAVCSFLRERSTSMASARLKYAWMGRENAERMRRLAGRQAVCRVRTACRELASGWDTNSS